MVCGCVTQNKRHTSQCICQSQGQMCCGLSSLGPGLGVCDSYLDSTPQATDKIQTSLSIILFVLAL